MTEYKSPLKTAICEFKKKGITIKKESKNPFFQSSYADLPTILDAIEEEAASCGLVIISSLKGMGESLQLETVLEHKDSDESRVSAFPVFGKKPQEIGSSISYARRYNIQSLLNLAAEDDDGNAASGNVTHQRQESAASRNKRFKAVSDAIQASDDPAVTWGEHKAAIDEFKATDAQFYDELVKLAKKRKDDLAALEMQKQQLGE